MRMLPWWAFLIGVLFVGGSAWLSVDWLLDIANGAPIESRLSVKMEAIRTGLSVAAGTGGFLALALAVRRQRLQERAQIHKEEVAAKNHDHQEQVATDARHDASEKRLTELYIKAADQLGSDKAAVRMAGLYALERLAQNNVEQRQTIVNLVCAYLRMPFLTDSAPSEDGAVGELISFDTEAGSPISLAQDSFEELQVRLAAQSILTKHLCAWFSLEAALREPPGLNFWPGMDLDLTRATLVDLNMTFLSVQRAFFTRARFFGSTIFSYADVSGPARFNGAQFGTLNFSAAKLNGQAWFDGAKFTGGAIITATDFRGHAGFSNSTGEILVLDDARFYSSANFSGARIDRMFRMNSAHFFGDVQFDPSNFVNLDDVRIYELDGTHRRSWPDGWEIVADGNSGGVLHAKG